MPQLDVVTILSNVHFYPIIFFSLFGFVTLYYGSMQKLFLNRVTINYDIHFFCMLQRHNAITVTDAGLPQISKKNNIEC